MKLYGELIMDRATHFFEWAAPKLSPLNIVVQQVGWSLYRSDGLYIGQVVLIQVRWSLYRSGGLYTGQMAFM